MRSRQYFWKTIYIKKNFILLICFLEGEGIRLAPHTLEPHFVPALSVTHKMSPFPFIRRNKTFDNFTCCFSSALTSIWICVISY